jgi:hypothetical protein
LLFSSLFSVCKEIEVKTDNVCCKWIFFPILQIYQGRKYHVNASDASLQNHMMG